MHTETDTVTREEQRAVAFVPRRQRLPGIVALPRRLLWRLGGFAIAVTLVTLALVWDVSRIWLAQKGLRERLEFAALAAVSELDGTAKGIRRAREMAYSRLTEGGKSARKLVSFRVEFAADPQGPWTESPEELMGQQAVRVTGTEAVSLGLVRLVARQSAGSVWASARAEQQEKQSVAVGLIPYSVVAHSAEGPSFGLRTGERYTLRWAREPSLDAGNVCPGDRVAEVVERVLQTRIRAYGFTEFGGAKDIRQAILEDHQTSTRVIGEGLLFTAGDTEAEREALSERVARDTDPVSVTYAEYAARGAGNGRRLVAVPIHLITDPARPVVQFAGFFLLPLEHYVRAGDHPICAEFVGGFMEGSGQRAAGYSGYRVASLSY